MTVTLKQYALHNLIVLLSTKFELDPVKTVGGVILKRKSSQKLSKGHNSANIWLTVTPKQYALHHLIVLLSTKFQLHLMKTVGGVIRKRKSSQKFSKGHNCKYLADSNLETICTTSPHSLTIYQL